MTTSNNSRGGVPNYGQSRKVPLFVRALRYKYPTVRAPPYLILELKERRFCGRSFGCLRLRICMLTHKVYLTSAVFTRITWALMMDTPVSSPHFNVYMHVIYQTKAQTFLFHIIRTVTIFVKNSGRKLRFRIAVKYSITIYFF